MQPVQLVEGQFSWISSGRTAILSFPIASSHNFAYPGLEVWDLDDFYHVLNTIIVNHLMYLVIGTSSSCDTTTLLKCGEATVRTFGSTVNFVKVNIESK